MMLDELSLIIRVPRADVSPLPHGVRGGEAHCLLSYNRKDARCGGNVIRRMINP